MDKAQHREQNEIARHTIPPKTPTITHFSLSSGSGTVTYKDIAAYSPESKDLKKRSIQEKTKGTTINLRMEMENMTGAQTGN